MSLKLLKIITYGHYKKLLIYQQNIIDGFVFVSKFLLLTELSTALYLSIITDKFYL